MVCYYCFDRFDCFDLFIVDKLVHHSKEWVFLIIAHPPHLLSFNICLLLPNTALFFFIPLFFCSNAAVIIAYNVGVERSAARQALVNIYLFTLFVFYVVL